MCRFLCFDCLQAVQSLCFVACSDENVGLRAPSSALRHNRLSRCRHSLVESLRPVLRSAVRSACGIVACARRRSSRISGFSRPGPGISLVEARLHAAQTCRSLKAPQGCFCLLAAAFSCFLDGSLGRQGLLDGNSRVQGKAPCDPWPKAHQGDVDGHSEAETKKLLDIVAKSLYTDKEASVSEAGKWASSAGSASSPGFHKRADLQRIGCV